MRNKVRVEYTHKGWFLFCPIWIADWQDGTPAITPRYRLEPLMWLADRFFELMQMAHQYKYGEPMPFCFKVYPTPLKKPVVHHYTRRDD